MACPSVCSWWGRVTAMPGFCALRAGWPRGRRTDRHGEEYEGAADEELCRRGGHDFDARLPAAAGVQAEGDRSRHRDRLRAGPDGDRPLAVAEVEGRLEVSGQAAAASDFSPSSSARSISTSLRSENAAIQCVS